MFIELYSLMEEECEIFHRRSTFFLGSIWCARLGSNGFVARIG